MIVPYIYVNINKDIPFIDFKSLNINLKYLNAIGFFLKFHILNFLMLCTNYV